MEENALIRDEKGRFQPGHTAPGPGRPKGKTLKEFQAEQFRQMSDEEKLEWLKDVGKDIRWKMAEGQPKQDTDITSGGLPIVQLAQEIIEKNEINTGTEPDSQE